MPTGELYRCTSLTIQCIVRQQIRSPQVLFWTLLLDRTELNLLNLLSIILSGWGWGISMNIVYLLGSQVKSFPPYLAHSQGGAYLCFHNPRPQVCWKQPKLQWGEGSLLVAPHVCSPTPFFCSVECFTRKQQVPFLKVPYMIHNIIPPPPPIFWHPL